MIIWGNEEACLAAMITLLKHMVPINILGKEWEEAWGVF